MTLVEWAEAPLLPQASVEMVDIWCAGLQRTGTATAALESLLSGDERRRAARYHFDIHRNRFIVARGLLRLILGRYLQQPPAALRFSYSDQGKPYLPGNALQFNLSHSDDLVVYAITEGRVLGIDVEPIQRPVEIAAVSSRFFSPAENQALQTLPPALQQAAFFACWTRKEAYIKARGDGLSLPLDSFDVTVRPDEAARLLRVREQPEELVRWSMLGFRPDDAHIAALVVEGTGWQPFWYRLD